MADRVGNRTLYAAALAVSLSACAACQVLFPRGPQHMEIEGPESPEVLADLEGTLVCVRTRIPPSSWAWGLSSLAPVNSAIPKNAVAISGLTESNHVAIVCQDGVAYSVRIVTLAGEEVEVIYQGRGRLDYNVSVALSSDGKRLAFLESVSAGAFDYSDWRILVYVVGGGLAAVLDAGFAPSGLCWTPDGRRLVYENDGAVYVWDASELTVQWLAQGTNPVPLPDSKHLFIRRSDGVGVVIDHESGVEVCRAILPGELYGVIGAPTNDVLLYHALPTKGQKAIPLSQGLMAPGWAWTIKAAKYRTGAFATVLEGVSSIRCSLGVGR